MRDHSPADELPDVPNPAQDLRDLYTIFGWVGSGAVGVIGAVGFLIITEPAHWWHVPYATVLGPVSMLPWIGAYGLAVHWRRSHARARRRHNARRWVGGRY